MGKAIRAAFLAITAFLVGPGPAHAQVAVTGFTILGATDVACGASSTASSAAPANTTHARIEVKTNAARVHVNGTAVATDTLKAPGVPEVFRVLATQTVSCIQDSAAGTMNVTFLQANTVAGSPGNYQPGAN